MYPFTITLTRTQLRNMRKWVAALRDGSHSQTKGLLKVIRHDGTAGYCCLGVYANTCLPKKERERVLKMTTKTGNRHKAVSKNAILSDQTWDNTGVNGILSQDELSGWNDGQISEFESDNEPRRRFSTIANLIEKRLKRHGIDL